MIFFEISKPFTNHTSIANSTRPSSAKYINRNLISKVTRIRENIAGIGGPLTYKR